MEAEHYRVSLEGFEFGASAWLDRFDLVRRAGDEPAFPITGTGVLTLRRPPFKTASAIACPDSASRPTSMAAR
jgi:hypothetical protein